MINNVNELVEYISNYGEKDVFCYLDNNDQVQHISFLKFANEIKQCAAYLDSLNINGKRLHVGILAKNCYEYQVYLLAIMMVDMVVIPLNARKSTEEIIYESGKAEIDILVCDDSIDEAIINYYTNNNLLIVKIDEYNNHTNVFTKKELNSKLLSMIMFTSGTTGKSKGVMLSQDNLFTSAQNKRDVLKQIISQIGLNNESDIPCLFMLPMSHIAGIRAMFDSYLSGNSTNIVSNVGNFYYELSKMPSLYIDVVPVVLEKINKDVINGRIDKLNGIRIIGCAGATANEKTFENLRKNNLYIVQHYGLTETSGNGTTNVSQKIEYFSSVGRLNDNIAYKIVEGELLLNGRSIMSGYYNDDDFSKEVIDKDGWFHTGDIFEIDDNEYFYVKGRKKNTIILSSGENINPEELENLLINNNKIIETYVKEKDNKICACIYCKEIDQVEIKKYVDELNKTLPYYKNISLIEYSDIEFEKTASGKIKRN